MTTNTENTITFQRSTTIPSFEVKTGLKDTPATAAISRMSTSFEVKTGSEQLGDKNISPEKNFRRVAMKIERKWQDLPPRSTPPRHKGKQNARDKKYARLQVQAHYESRVTEYAKGDLELRKRLRIIKPQAFCDPPNRTLWHLIDTHMIQWCLSKFHTQKSFDNFVVKLYEDVLFYIVDLIEDFSSRHIFNATLRFIKYRYGTVFSNSTINDLAQRFVSFYQMVVGVVPQNDNPFKPLRSLINCFDEVRNAPIFKKLYKFIMYVMCSSILEQFGASKKFCESLFDKLHLDATLKRKFHYSVDFFHCMFDTLVYVCEIGYQCFMMGSFEPIFHSGTTYTEWFDKAYELKRKSLLTANCEAHGFTLFEYLHDLDDVIETGTSIAKHALNVGDFERLSIKTLLNDIKIIRDMELTKKHAAQSRQAPFSMLLHGGSSVGKSSFTDILFAHYAKVHKMPQGEEYIYTRNPNDEYWSTFRTSQWGIKLDDIGFLRPEKAQNGDPSLLEMLQVINNVPFTPAQADLADKGKTPVKARFVVATSNAVDLNAFHYFSCSLAVRRRLPWVVTISPKAQYTKDKTMLNPAALPVLEDNEYPDYWNIRVQRVVPRGNDVDRQQAGLVNVAEFDDINAFLAWFAIQSMEFERLQRLALNVSQKIKTIQLCDRCYFSKDLCKCVELGGQNILVRPQSDPDEKGESEWVKLTIKRIREENDPDSVITAIKRSLSLKDSFMLWCYFEMDAWTLIALWTFCLFLHRCVFSIFWIFWLLCILTYFSRPTCDRMYGRTSMLLYITSLAINPVGKYYWTKTMRRAGMIMQGKFSHVAFSSCALITSAVVICSMSSLFFKNSDVIPQGKTDEELNPGQAPKDTDEETFNPWVKESFALTSFDVSEMTSSYNGLGAEKVLKMLSANCVYFKIDGYKSQRAFCVGGHFYLVNSHGVPNGDFKLTIIENFDSDGVTANLKSILVTQSMVSRIPEKDLAIVRINNVPPRKDFRNLFCQPSMQGRWKGCYIGRNRLGSFTQMRVDNINFEKDVHNSYLNSKADSWVGTVAEDTVDGDCGYLLMTMTPKGPVLLGIHYLGGMESKLAISAKVTVEDIDTLMRKFNAVVVQSGHPKLSAEGAERKLGPLHKKSVFRYIESGTTRVYGSFEGFRPRLKSSVGPTLMNLSMKARGYIEQYGPPVVEGYRPWRIAALDLTMPVTEMRQDILDDCVLNFSTDILRLLPKDELQKIIVYDYFTAINGAAGVKFVDKLNRNTSMGCPWKKSKKHFMFSVAPVGNLLDPIQFHESIMRRVESIELQYRQGYRVCPVFCGNLKDEAVSLPKVFEGKTRVFCGAPVDWSIVVRKYLLAFIRVVQRNTFIFESAPGTVSQSLQWEKIYRYLCYHGKERGVAGDYKAFDKRMGSILILAAFQVIVSVCKAAGFEECDILVIHCIAEDTAFSFVDYNGDLVEFFGSNPSGHPLTVIVNGLVNSLYMRYCYAVLSPDGTSIDFKKHVNLITYGDDNAMGVSKEIAFFDHTSIVQVLADIGVTYTMADKKSKSVPFVNIDEINFLKRRFRFDADVGAILAPLEEDSIIKSLMTCVKSKSVSFEHQCVDIIGAAVREYFNYGKDLFEAKCQMLHEIIDECGLNSYVNGATFPTFDQLKEEFWRASKGIDVDKLRVQSYSICPRCENEDCPYKDDIQDDFYLLCCHCLYCVDFSEDDVCPRCGCDLYW